MPAEATLVRGVGMGAPRDEYGGRYTVRLLDRLGFGRDGAVWYTDRLTAVKLYSDAGAYARERDVYVMLDVPGITSLLGHAVPAHVRHDGELLALEMTIVRPPYFLDFASAYAEHDVPDFPADAWDEWLAEKAESFGDRWPQVLRLRDELRDLLGVVLLDLNPGNITFA